MTISNNIHIYWADESTLTVFAIETHLDAEWYDIGIDAHTRCPNGITFLTTATDDPTPMDHITATALLRTATPIITDDDMDDE